MQDQSVSFLIETDRYGYRVGMNPFMGLEKQGDLEGGMQYSPPPNSRQFVYA